MLSVECCPALARRFLLPLLTIGWSGMFLLEALQRWRFERICAMTCGPFWEVGTVELIKGAMDWHTPLALAAMPFFVMCGWRLLSRGGGSLAGPRPR